jgi:NAD(P)-dependent dehydrogenase (short-subunit alcohol dehydrogenase family)
MNERLGGKVAIVMGGGAPSGAAGVSNGEAVARTFARHGARVVVADLQLDAAERTAERIREDGGQASALACDASRDVEVRAVVEHALRTFGRVDIQHNNVGIEQLGGPVETEESDWDRVHAVNLKSVFLACKHVIPVMERQGGGVILNISSTASLRWSGVPYLAYNSSKAALNQVTRIVARQYAPKQIRCNAIVPGYLDTPHTRALFGHLNDQAFAETMENRDAKCPMGRQGTPQDIANAALFLASDEASYITGHLLLVDGGSTI